MPHSTPRAYSYRTMVLMGIMMAGAGSVDAITANMLPITAKHFTGSIWLIGVMVALNRLCGFLIQPYAAWKSDRHRSAGGRRRPFLLVSWPATLVSVSLLGALPYLVPKEYYRTTGVLAVLFVANLAMQAFLDVCYGSADPMYGDSFASNELGRANGVRTIIGNLAGALMTLVFVPLADHHEYFPYLGCMIFVTSSWLVTGFFIKETIPENLPARGAYHPLKPLFELRNPRTRSVAVVASASLVALALTEMLHSLFVTETLGFSKTDLGLTTTAGLAISLLCPYSLGFLVDRIGPRTVLIAGFLGVLAVEAGFVFWVNDLVSLYVCMILFKVAWFFIYIPVMPLMFQNASPERRGTVFASVQMTRAAIASAATIVAASFADWFASYRVCYVLAGAACVIGLLGALRIRTESTMRRGAEAA